MPMGLLWQETLLSFPVDFQYPARVALFVLNPFGYFLSRGPKKYHSGSLLGKNDFSNHATRQQKMFQNQSQLNNFALLKMQAIYSASN